MSAGRSDAIVLFGASGDLARKMTFVSLYHLAERGLLDMPIVGVAFSEWSDDELREHARKAVEEAGVTPDEGTWKAMSARMRFVQGDYTKPETYSAVAEAVKGAERPLYYLEIPPSLFETVVKGLHDAGLVQHEGVRVVVEKPFGHDLESARGLYRKLSSMLHDEQLYRIDHYLGKNQVQNIMVWRFANRMFEPVWNNEHIDCVQITMAESFDVADRGSFYDKVGALKDVVQNHIMQIVGLLAMDPPVSARPADLHVAQRAVFSAMRPVGPEDVVRGRYRGYLDVEGVADDSTTETFIALRVHIDSWRWAGVPFLIRAGKSLAATATEAVVVFKPPPLDLFGADLHGGAAPTPNRIRFRLGHHDGVQVRVQALDPTSTCGMASTDIVLDVDFDQALGRERLPYEQLLGDALDGDMTRFATQGIIEGTWAALDPVVQSPPGVIDYDRGSMGPTEAEALVDGHAAWIDPIAGPSERPA
ncbi:MAG: glucose-6-phosphate dehydrogenase [Planctomycetota bacterium]|nr:glucose-6-phosphate dehydrogenase [Planctomycetota bacterium]